MVKKHVRFYSSTAFDVSHRLSNNADPNYMRQNVLWNNFFNMSSFKLSLSSSLRG